MPPINDRIYQKGIDKSEREGSKTGCVVFKGSDIVFSGGFEEASLICHNLNKKCYRDNEWKKNQ